MLARHLHRQHALRREHRRKPSHQAGVIGQPVQHRIGKDQRGWPGGLPLGDVRRQTPLVGAGRLRNAQHRRRRIDAQDLAPGKARRERRPGGAVAATKIDHVTRRQRADLRQQIERGRQPQPAKAGIGRRVPVAQSQPLRLK